MNTADYDYFTLLDDVMSFGETRLDRTGVGTKALFGYQMRFDLSEGFPLLTTKRIFWKGVVEELLWFLRGETNVRSLQDKGVKIWDEWADENGDLGPVYGSQWRSWPDGPKHFAKGGAPVALDGIDQIKNVIERIKTNPHCRRLIVSAWNPAEIDECRLPPCHVLFQFDVSKDMKLSCQLYQRSADVFLGVPFNIASYALLTHMIAQVCGLEVGEFIWVGGNTHIYTNHFEQVETQLQRDPRQAPQLSLNRSITDIDKFTFDDITLIGYDPHPAIKAEVAV